MHPCAVPQKDTCELFLLYGLLIYCMDMCELCAALLPVRPIRQRAQGDLG